MEKLCDNTMLCGKHEMLLIVIVPSVPLNNDVKQFLALDVFP